MNAEDGTDLGYVGRVVKTNEGLMAAMLNAGVTPVVACLALGASRFRILQRQRGSDGGGGRRRCKAESLVFVTDVGGVTTAHGERIAELDRKRVTIF